MSADSELIIEMVPPGSGNVLDLGGGSGMLRRPLEQLGYHYINADIEPAPDSGAPVIGDAHTLPFQSHGFDLVVSKDTLEHFIQPWIVVEEVYRVLRPGGLLVLWVPFLHPFHASDFYRYTPLALRHMFRRFELLRLDSPHGLITLASVATCTALRKLHLNPVATQLQRVTRRFDRCVSSGERLSSFAAGYRVVARRPAER
jgi:SAM-dependent methyltransferase